MSHIYIHFPYCLYKCHYCDFNSYATESQEIPHDAYTSALVNEIKNRREIFQQTGESFFQPKTKIKSIFFDGGTPSLMTQESLESILNTLQKEFTLSANTEITLECNPGTLNQINLKQFKTAGINRISLGIQSFQEKNLQRFGRIHTGQQAQQALQMIANAGFSNISADLIFGFPDQTLAEWQQDLLTLLAHPLTHLSCYSLTAETGTQYTQDLKKGRYTPPDDDKITHMFEWTHEHLNNAGFPAYEVSNFAQPQNQSQHNLAYWQYKPYLGLGAGAYSSFLAPHPTAENFINRQVNQKSPHSYMKNADSSDLFHTEIITKKTAMFEFLMMGLRLNSGIDQDDFHSFFGEDIKTIFADALTQALNLGHIKHETRRILLTPEGFLKQNHVLQTFLVQE